MADATMTDTALVGLENNNSNNNDFERKSSLGSLPDRVQEQAQIDVTTTSNSNRITLVAKFGKEKITLADVDDDITIGRVKELLQERTRVLPKRQKLVGLVAVQGGAKGVNDDLPLSGLKIKGKSATAGTTVDVVHQFILMGTPEEEIFIDPSDRDDLPDVSPTHLSCRIIKLLHDHTSSPSLTPYCPLFLLLRYQIGR